MTFRVILVSPFSMKSVGITVAVFLAFLFYPTCWAELPIPGQEILIQAGYQMGTEFKPSLYRVRKGNEEFLAKKLIKTGDTEADFALEVIRRTSQKHPRSFDSPYLVETLEFLENDQYFWQVMKHEARGDASTTRTWTQSSFRTFARDAARAVSILHHQGVCHRDIKPQNFLRENPSRLIDFDFAFRAAVMADERVGTPYYIAPEVLSGNPHHCQPSDIWSLGATYYHMVTGQHVVVGKNLDTYMGNLSDLYKRKASVAFPSPWEWQYSLQNPILLLDLIKKMLRLVPQNRITIDEVLEHAFLQSA